MGWVTYDNTGARLERSFSDTPVGTITGYAGATPPNGWLKCDNSAVSRTTYAELYSVIGTTYGTGDGSTTFNLPNGDGDMIYAQSVSSRVTTSLPPQYVTSLPSSPVDGQTVVYAADATNGVMWTLRYRAASSSSYKWECIGGTALTASVATAQGTTSGTYTDLSTAGPTITLPLAGDYDIGIAAAMSSTTTGYGGNVSFSVSGGAASSAADADGMLMLDANANIAESSSTVTRKTGLTAAAVTMRYRMTVGGTATFSNRKLSITPVRVG